MSDYSTPPKPGYTKTGKSLKAVRRYYALKEGARNRRSPENKDEDEQHRSDRSPSSRRKRSPDDDKLSKRIQAELETQREAIEKRAKNSPMKLQPERSPTTQIIHKPKESGPLFVAESEPTPRPASSGKSTKSYKSYRSNGSYNPTEPNMTFVFDIGVTATGCITTCFIFALVFIITWIFMLAADRNRFDTALGVLKQTSLKVVGWLAATSILVVLAVPYWFWCRNTFKHALVSLTLMILSTFCIIVQVFSAFLSDDYKSSSSNKVYFPTPNPLCVCLSLTYLLYHVISVSFMTQQLLNLVSRQIGEKSAERNADQLQMSQYLAPT